MKMQAIWNGKVLAESDATRVVEGNYYFPADAIAPEYFLPSDQKSRCFWKGTASYYDIVVDGKRNEAAAWFYPEPSAAAKLIKDHVAFWRGVEVVNLSEGQN
ncbi:MAG: DUF427 domain-containing protein [Anaerolineales bacterium]|nr:DUF427 domain-containing protein [Anaerolineales bacterium]